MPSNAPWISGSRFDLGRKPPPVTAEVVIDAADARRSRLRSASSNEGAIDAAQARRSRLRSGPRGVHGGDAADGGNRFFNQVVPRHPDGLVAEGGELGVAPLVALNAAW